ncbi:hypothetical protein M2282_002843 [Variovorax boronicumulans]|uniref:hypothetical protein n=1 Tax=Variovorax boronicumulans TaxID=436515 RepID=UPI002473F1DA|nr:hypothetical protein [Variovorax boronicumulans]MDH6167693.1 hypothetical protein [Variovorax boronicumulans]
MTARQSVRNMCIAMAASSILAACGSRDPQAPEQTPPAPVAYNAVTLPPVVYGHYQGRQMSESDDACGVPDPLRQAVQDQLKARYEVVLPVPGTGREAAPLLKIEIMDIVTVSAGGPTIVAIHAVLERPGMPAAQFKGLRQMHTRASDITAETTECSSMDAVIYGLGADVAKWMLEPVDGVSLVNGE